LIGLQENIGFAAANNLALQSCASFDWIALVNPDAFPEPRWLETLLAAAQKHPDFSFFGSRLILNADPARLDGTGDIYHVSGMAWRRDEGSANRPDKGDLGEIFSPCAAAALYRTEALIEVGGFDEDYFCYHEDVDCGFRLRLAGYRCLYVPEAVARHVGSALTGRRSDFSVYHGHRNLVWTFAKNMPWPLLLAYLPQHLVLNLAGIVRYTLRGQGRVILRAKYDALRGLARAWRKRRHVQQHRRISSGELRRSLTGRWWRPYWGKR
jgi:GT2 family glycosyltransferase